MKKLDSQKVITEIGELADELKDRINKREDFGDIHKKVLRLCKEIFSTKKDYKVIDEKYPSPIRIVWEDSTQISALPSEEDIWKQKADLGTKILTVLQEAHEVFSLKLRIQIDD